jgi:hypothetical protein
MNEKTAEPQSAPIQPRTTTPGQDPLVNPGYQPMPQDLPPVNQPLPDTPSRSAS